MEIKDYNTLRKRLIQPEYGRCVQQMVEHAVTIPDKAKRQQCAETIVALMARMDEKHSNEDDFYQKLWNHLAAMSDYQLDIDYPVEMSVRPSPSTCLTTSTGFRNAIMAFCWSNWWRSWARWTTAIPKRKKN